MSFGMSFDSTDAKALVEFVIHEFGLQALAQELQRPDSFFKKLVSLITAHNRAFEEKQLLTTAIDTQTQKIQILELEIEELKKQTTSNNTVDLSQEQNRLQELQEQLRQEREKLEKMKKEIQKFKEDQTALLSSYAKDVADVAKKQNEELLEKTEKWLKDRPVTETSSPEARATRAKVEDSKDVLEAAKKSQPKFEAKAKELMQQIKALEAEPTTPAPKPQGATQTKKTPSPPEEDKDLVMLRQRFFANLVFQALTNDVIGRSSEKTGVIDEAKKQELAKARNKSTGDHTAKSSKLKSEFDSKATAVGDALIDTATKVDGIDAQVVKTQADIATKLKAPAPGSSKSEDEEEARKATATVSLKQTKTS